MEGLSVARYGYAFVAEALKRYWGGAWPVPVFFVLAMLFSVLVTTVSLRGGRAGSTALSIRRGHLKNVRLCTRMFGAMTVFLLLTLLNPVAAAWFVPKFSMTQMYYRSFWALPVLAGAAYYLVRVFQAAGRGLRRGVLKRAAVIVCTGLVCALIPLSPGFVRGLKLPDNIYKVPGAVPVICEGIHEDFDARSETEMPKCIFSYQLEFYVRQYDASIRLTMTRNERLYYEGNRSTGLDFSDSERYKRRAVILNGMYGRDDSISAEEFAACMEKTNTDYLIVEEEAAAAQFLERAGCTVAFTEAGYAVYRFEGTEE